jgi:hypothetical protein
MEIPMKTFYRLATFALMMSMSVLAASAFAQNRQATVLSNITEGQGTITSSGNPQWDGMSELVLIPGASLMGSATSTVLYIGFTGGSEADIDNMVLYTTARNANEITATKKVTLGKLANPSINLTSTSVCPVQPVSATNPCIIALDKISGALSPLDDYYFAIYFTLDTNNEKILGAGQSPAPGALSGWDLYGDQTRIGKDGALPIGNTDQPPFFLLYVASE